MLFLSLPDTTNGFGRVLPRHPNKFGVWIPRFLCFHQQWSLQLPQRTTTAHSQKLEFRHELNHGRQPWKWPTMTQLDTSYSSHCWFLSNQSTPLSPRSQTKRIAPLLLATSSLIYVACVSTRCQRYASGVDHTSVSTSSGNRILSHSWTQHTPNYAVYARPNEWPSVIPSSTLTDVRRLSTSRQRWEVHVPARLGSYGSCNPTKEGGLWWGWGNYPKTELVGC